MGLFDTVKDTISDAADTVTSPLEDESDDSGESGGSSPTDDGQTPSDSSSSGDQTSGRHSGPGIGLPGPAQGTERATERSSTGEGPQSRQQSSQSPREQSQQDSVDREIQQILESDRQTVSEATGATSGYAGQESATNVQRELPKTPLQRGLEPIQEAGREYNRREGEQFGDWAWSVGPFDDLEKGARDVQEGAADFGGNIGEGAGSNTGVPGALEAAGFEKTADRLDRTAGSFGRGVGEGAGGLIGGIPVIGMEAAETTGYAATNPREAAGKAPNALAGSAVATSRQIGENPAQALGAIAAETVISAGAGAGATRGARALARRRPSIPDPSARTPRTLAGDDRGQMTLGDVGRKNRRGGDSDSPAESSRTPSSESGSGEGMLSDEIQQALENFERGTGIREANRRAEKQITEKRLEEGRRQERGDEPRSVDTRPGGDYSAPDGPGGDYTAPQSPDTSRSGPRGPQSSAGQSRLDSELSPRETQLAAKLGRQTPGADMRGVDDIARTAPETDFRTAMDTTSRSAAEAGLAATGAASAVTRETSARLDDAQQPEVTADDVLPPGTREDTSVRSRADAGTDSLDILADADAATVGVASDIDTYLDSLRDTATTTQTDSQSDGATDPWSQTDRDSGQQPNTDPTPPRDSDTPLPGDGDPTPPPRGLGGRPGRPFNDDPSGRRPRRPRLPELETESATTITDSGLEFDQIRVEYDVPDPGLLGGDVVDDSTDYEVVDDSKEFELVDESETAAQSASADAASETADDWQQEVDQADGSVLEALDEIDQSLNRGIAETQSTEQPAPERTNSQTVGRSRSPVPSSSSSFVVDPMSGTASATVAAFGTTVSDAGRRSGGATKTGTSSSSVDLISELDDEYASLDASLDELETDLEAELDALDNLEGFDDAW